LKKLEVGTPTTSVEKLVGYKNSFRIRAGNYRVVYRIIGGKIYIVLIGHRKDIYEKLKKLFG
jgi:mRNA-degrading endonuclease RelE of RelBE toxin-antitoxin system